MISVFELYTIGIGPSSSHTVGPMRAALEFVEALTQKKMLSQTDRVQCQLYGSLGATGRGHGSDKAVLLGLLGESPETVDVGKIDNYLDDIYQRTHLALNHCRLINFHPEHDLILHSNKSLPYHPNAMMLSAYGDGHLLLQITYYSIGGGFIVTDQEVSEQRQNSAGSSPSAAIPYPFTDAKTLHNHCQREHMRIDEVVLANELTFHHRNDITKRLNAIWQAMQACVRAGCNATGVLPGGLGIRRRANDLYLQLLQEQASHQHPSLYEMDWVNLYALAVNEENAAGGRVVTAPTNGAAGIIPAVLHYFRDFHQCYCPQKVEQFLLTAAAIGMIIKQNASISGAEAGCQGEVGSACAMAAAGLAAVLNANLKQCLNAAEIGIEHNLGLTCDPVAGLVQIPCIERNAIGAVKAINAARMAQRGDGQHFVSLDNAIATMKATGDDMKSKYKETARGGLATHAIEVPVNFVDC